MWMCVQLCLTVCDPMDCILPGPSVHGIFQARVLKWVAISYSRGASWPKSPASPALAGGFFTTRVTWEALLSSSSWDVLKSPCWVHLLIWAGITGLNFPLRLRPCAHMFYLYRSKHLDHFVTLGWSLEVIVYVRSTYQILLEKGLCFNFTISQREQLAYF